MYINEKSSKGVKIVYCLYSLEEIKAKNFLRLNEEGYYEDFFDEICSKPPKENYPSNKIIYIQINEIWSSDLADIIDYKISNVKVFRYIFVITDSFSKYLWCIPLKRMLKQGYKSFQVFYQHPNDLFF